MDKIDVLFRPKKIGNLEIKNRFVMAPMMTRSAEGGMVTQAMVNYYAERAKGGTGLIIVEFTKCESQIEPVISPHHLRIDTQQHQDAFKLLTEAIHSNTVSDDGWWRPVGLRTTTNGPRTGRPPAGVRSPAHVTGRPARGPGGGGLGDKRPSGPIRPVDRWRARLAPEPGPPTPARPGSDAVFRAIRDTAVGPNSLCVLQSGTLSDRIGGPA